MRKGVAKSVIVMRAIATLRGWSTGGYFSAVSNSWRVYATYVPRTMNRTRTKPLVIALHGRRGGIYEFVSTDLAKYAQEHEFIIACPAWKSACRDASSVEQEIIELLAVLRLKHSIDDKRIYLLGISMGARAAIRVGFLNVDLFAAMAPFYSVPIGDALLDLAAHGKKLPVFVAHGTLDSVIPIHHSLRLADALISSH